MRSATWKRIKEQFSLFADRVSAETLRAINCDCIFLVAYIFASWFYGVWDYKARSGRVLKWSTLRLVCSNRRSKSAYGAQNRFSLPPATLYNPSLLKRGRICAVRKSPATQAKSPPTY